MALTASPKLALKRGALTTAANWHVVLVQFIADALYTTLLALPVVGGAALVALTSGLDPKSLFDLGARRAVLTVAAALLAHPLALAAFLTAVAVVLLGGSLFMAFVKGGTIAILAEAEREAGPIEQPPLHLSAVRAASRFSLERATNGAQGLFGRFARLGCGLFTAYAVVLGVAGVTFTQGGSGGGWEAARLAGITAGVAIAITLVNLLYLLAQIVIAVDDCDVLTALGRVGAFLTRQPRAIAVVFAVASTLVALGTAASVLATAALGLIAFVPFVGLAALPLQVGAWLVRGFVFQFLGLTALVAYMRLYRLSSGGGGDAA